SRVLWDDRVRIGCAGVLLSQGQYSAPHRAVLNARTAHASGMIPKELVIRVDRLPSLLLQHGVLGQLWSDMTRLRHSLKRILGGARHLGRRATFPRSAVLILRPPRPRVSAAPLRHRKDQRLSIDGIPSVVGYVRIM